MPLTDEQLDALAERLSFAYYEAKLCGFHTVAREAARWAAEQQGEVVWEFLHQQEKWIACTRDLAAKAQRRGLAVRAIRVIATTTKGVG